MRRVVVLIALFLLMGASLACAPEAFPGEEGPETVRGVLLEVVSSTFVRVEQIRLRDDRNQEWVFTIAEDASGDEGEPLSAAHLRQHMAFGEPVTVRYRQTNAGPVALRIADTSGEPND